MATLTRAGDHRRPVKLPRAANSEVRPFSFEPVMRICAEGRGRGWCVTRHGVTLREHGTAEPVTEALGVSRSTVSRMLRRGVTAYQADALAVALGRHPCEVWPEWWHVTFECMGVAS